MAISNPYRPAVPPYTDPGGYLLANQLLDPNQVQGQTTMQNRLAPWSNWDGDAGNDQIAKEQLPPWDNDPSLLPPRLTWEQQIAASRPADYNIDPRMQANPGYYTPRSFKVWHGGTVRTPGAVSTYQDPGEFPTMRWLLPAAREQTD